MQAPRSFGEFTRYRDGSVVPAGATLSLEPGKLRWTVGDEGLAYLEDLPAGARLTVDASGGEVHCTAILDVPKDLSSVPDIGIVTCL